MSSNRRSVKDCWRRNGDFARRLRWHRQPRRHEFKGILEANEQAYAPVGRALIPALELTLLGNPRLLQPEIKYYYYWRRLITNPKRILGTARDTL